MSHGESLIDFCRFAFDDGGAGLTAYPLRLAAAFREYFGIHSTPTFVETISLVLRLGIRPDAVDYLETGGTNMTAGGEWYVHYSSNDRPATQKFTIFHELFEIIDKVLGQVDCTHSRLREPQLSRYADRFAAAVLLPRHFFMRQMIESGCDVVQLAEQLELSHQCLLIGFAQHLEDTPLVGVLYEYCPASPLSGPLATTRDFVATVVVKTLPVRSLRQLCPRQPVPVRNTRPCRGSLVCTAITSGQPVLWRDTKDERYPVVLVRPLLRGGLEPYRVILLALPSHEQSMLQPQIQCIRPMELDGQDPCPLIGIDPECNDCSGE